MPVDIYRGTLTDLMLAAIATSLDTADFTIPVGDGVIPEGSGWIGEPGAPTSKFQPYCVLVPMVAQTSSGPFDDPQGDWRLPYGVFSYSVSRKGVEWIADRARSALNSFWHTTVSLNSIDFVVQQVRIDMIGGAQRVDQTDPPYWGQTDGQTIWLSKE